MLHNTSWDHTIEHKCVTNPVLVKVFNNVQVSSFHPKSYDTLNLSRLYNTFYAEITGMQTFHNLQLHCHPVPWQLWCLAASVHEHFEQIVSAAVTRDNWSHLTSSLTHPKWRKSQAIPPAYSWHLSCRLQLNKILEVAQFLCTWLLYNTAILTTAYYLWLYHLW